MRFLTPDEAVDGALASARLSGYEPCPEFEARFRQAAREGWTDRLVQLYVIEAKAKARGWPAPFTWPEPIDEAPDPQKGS